MWVGGGFVSRCVEEYILVFILHAKVFIYRFGCVYICQMFWGYI